MLEDAELAVSALALWGARFRGWPAKTCVQHYQRTATYCRQLETQSQLAICQLDETDATRIRSLSRFRSFLRRLLELCAAPPLVPLPTSALTNYIGRAVFSLATFAAFLRPAAVARPAARRSVSFMSLIRHWGGPGLFVLAVLDGLPVPTFGGPDILTAILAARHREPWYYYAAMTASGSLIGSYITYRAARQAGASYLEKWFGERRVSKLLDLFDRWGTGGLLFSTALPVPFPTYALFAAAGVVKYPTRRFLGVVGVGRMFRYGAIALIASVYGRQFIRVLRHPQQYAGWFVLILGVVAMLIAAAVWLKKQMSLEEQGASVVSQ